MAITNMRTYIQTPRSELNLGKFGDQSLVARAIEEVKSTLLHYPPIMIGTKTVQQRRDVGFYSDESEGYRYSGQIARSQPLTASLKELMRVVNLHFNANFNGILINCYNGGKDFIGPHSDDEKFLDREAGIVAISSGATRCFRIRSKTNLSFLQDVSLTHMSVVHMSGDFQKEFTHAVPPELGDGVRYSFTFRCHTA